MLILVRKPQQAFWINDEVCVRVLEIGNERVKVGISAPRATKVIREELLVDIDPSAYPSVSVGDVD